MVVTRFPSHLRLIGAGQPLITTAAEPTRIHPELLPDADRDHLTGTATRAALLARLEMVGSLAPSMPLSFLAVHVEADELNAPMLRAVAARLRELTRPTDAVGRLDDATFGIVLQGTGVTAAGAVAARLVHHLNRLPGAPREFSVTVSAATGTGLNGATLPEAAMETFAAGCC
jgi:GGDEF domain-containing protein